MGFEEVSTFGSRTIVIEVANTTKVEANTFKVVEEAIDSYSDL